MQDDQLLSRRKRLVSAAKAIFSGQIGITVGANRVMSRARELEVEGDDDFAIFRSFLGKIPVGMPIGSSRLLWNSEKVIESDRDLAVIESQFREEVMKQCAHLIEKYAGSDVL